MLTGAEPVLLLEEHDKGREEEFVRIRKYKALILGITLEERGPLQAIVRYEGTHIREDGERRIPFMTVRSLDLSILFCMMGRRTGTF